MKISVFSENTWIYPDMSIDEENAFINLDAARGGMVCFQVLTDLEAADEAEIEICAGLMPGMKITVYQLLPVCVDRNSGKDSLTGRMRMWRILQREKHRFLCTMQCARSKMDGFAEAGWHCLCV